MLLKARRVLLSATLIYLITILIAAFLIRGSSVTAHLTLPATAPQILFAAFNDVDYERDDLITQGYTPISTNGEIVTGLIDKPLLFGSNPQEQPLYYHSAGYSERGAPVFRRYFFLRQGRICALDLDSAFPSIGSCLKVFIRSGELLFCNSNSYCLGPVHIKEQE
jgi:hypothetical protein